MGEKKETVVLTSGVFDLLHYGHVCFLEEAKRAGGKNAKLIVIIARDATVKRLKGEKPVMPEDQRRALVEALKPVDAAILGYEDLSFGDVIEKIRPDVIAVGYDQKFIEGSVRKIVAEKGLDIRVVRIGKLGPKDLNSSSKIKRKIISEMR